MAIIMVQRHGVVPQAAGASPCCAAKAEHFGGWDGSGFHPVQVAPGAGAGPLLRSEGEAGVRMVRRVRISPRQWPAAKPVVGARRP
jgi:hypothetical protein